MHLVKPEPHPFLHSGEKVLIRRGPLEGMTGIVVRQKNGARVVLSLEAILKSISVEVGSQDLELAGRRPEPYGYSNVHSPPAVPAA